MKPTATLRSFLLFAGSSLLAASISQAADVTWDIIPGTVGAGDSLVTGGTGAWNTSLAAVPNGNWTTNAGVNNVAWVNANNDTAVFGGTAGTVTLGEAISVGGVKINTASYVISGNTLTLASGTNLESSVGNSTTNTPRIDSALAGSAGFTKTGTGWLQLNDSSNPDTLSGNINIQAGTLYARHEALGTGGIVFTGNSTFIKVYNANANFPSTMGVAVDPGVSATISAATFYYNANFAGALSGGTTSSLIVANAGNTEIAFNSTSNTFEGQLTLSGSGTADNGSRAVFKSLADSSQKIQLNNTLIRLASGGVAMNFSNRPIEILHNARIDNDSTTGTSAVITIAKDLTATIGNNARSLTLSGVNTGDNIFGGKISNSATGSGAVSMVKQEAGKWILSGDNSYTGTTTVSAGLLEIGGSGRLGSGNYAANISIASTSSGTLKFNSSANQTLGGVISGAGALVKDNDNGILTLTNDNTYTGATTVDGGTLLINGSTSSTSLVTVNNSGTLGGTGSIGGSVTLNDGAFLSPGASIESLATGSNTWNGGSTVVFEFSTDGSTGSAGNQWDLLGITGTLELAGATSINPISLDLISMADALNSGLLAAWDPDSNALWSGFVTTTGGINGFAANLFDIDTTGFQNGLNGNFSVVKNGTNLDLVYTAIPEPRAALLGGLGFLMLLRRRR